MNCFGSCVDFSFSIDTEGKRCFLTKTATSKLKERKGASMTDEGGCLMNSMAHRDLAEGH